MNPVRLQGLVAATHTPFTADGDLNLAAVEKQAGHLLATGVTAAFVGGTTGESASLTVDERLALADRWAAVLRGTPLRWRCSACRSTAARFRSPAAVNGVWVAATRPCSLIVMRVAPGRKVRAGAG